MSLVAAVKGLGLRWRLGDWLNLPVCIPTVAAPLPFAFLGLSNARAHALMHITHLLSFFLHVASLHYREDGGDYLQFSNLYDSALF